jgi:hypothetical protein
LFRPPHDLIKRGPFEQVFPSLQLSFLPSPHSNAQKGKKDSSTKQEVVIGEYSRTNGI